MCETALVKLATSARDAMPESGALILAAEQEIVVGRHSEGLAAVFYIRISVTDTSIGMNAALLRRVMEPFFTAKPQDKGTGIGLPMARSFAEQSGGVPAVTSVPAAGRP